MNHLTRYLMSFEELEQFIKQQNDQLALRNQILCANVSNAYSFNIVRVSKSFSLNEKIVTAQASFRVESSIHDCQFDHPIEEIDWIYLGPIIACSFLGVFNLMLTCFLIRAIKRLDPNNALFL